LKTTRPQNLLAAALVGALVFSATAARGAEPLPSWNDGKAKQSIMDFVPKVTKQGGPDFVPPAEHIAMLDNDGPTGCGPREGCEVRNRRQCAARILSTAACDDGSDPLREEGSGTVIDERETRLCSNAFCLSFSH
jgi:hypothetical protein